MDVDTIVKTDWAQLQAKIKRDSALSWLDSCDKTLYEAVAGIHKDVVTIEWIRTLASASAKAQDEYMTAQWEFSRLWRESILLSAEEFNKMGKYATDVTTDALHSEAFVETAERERS